MEKFQPLLLKVWRAACRHIEIDQSAETISAMLTDDLPLERLLIRQIDPERRYLETVALCPAALDHRASARRELSAAELRELLEWCREGVPAATIGPKPLPPPAALAAGDWGDRPVLAGPLGSDAEQPGVLVVVAPQGATLSARHVAMLAALLEPFSAALENDRRLREMAALKDAAEADRNSLLTKLGRQQMADTIVGAASGLRLVLERVKLVAAADAPVLIFGETGTGKELIARTIHARSRRAEGPILRVNCGAIPPELIDSELFGHERGAFTGATGDRRGWFERADGGTLFLDEIGELAPAAQVRLLRILQDGWLQRVGGHHPIHVDVRIVAATHCDLQGMVAEGRFREDLWYRLAVFPIFLPPLRERRDDVPELVRHFARRAATRFGLPPCEPTADDLELLMRYDWPGNVREVAAVIDRAAILGDGHRLEVAKALGVAPLPSRPVGSPAQEPQRRAPDGVALPLDDVIRSHIEDVLVATRGRVEGPFGAAVRLKVNPHTLRARMRKLGVDWARFRR